MQHTRHYSRRHTQQPIAARLTWYERDANSVVSSPVETYVLHVFLFISVRLSFAPQTVTHLHTDRDRDRKLNQNEPTTTNQNVKATWRLEVRADMWSKRNWRTEQNACAPRLNEIPHRIVFNLYVVFNNTKNTCYLYNCNLKMGKISHSTKKICCIQFLGSVLIITN